MDTQAVVDKIEDRRAELDKKASAPGQNADAKKKSVARVTAAEACRKAVAAVAKRYPNSAKATMVDAIAPVRAAYKKNHSTVEADTCDEIVALIPAE